MNKIYFLSFVCLLLNDAACFAQVKEPADTFFLLNKKGLLKKIGKSIYREPSPETPIKSVNPFLAYKGRVIRSITIAPTGFNKIEHDTLGIKKTFVSQMADRFHRNTLPEVIRKNLLFREGDRVLPVLLSDNERYLRDLGFLRDARIVVETDSLSPDAADIIIITRDVFSIGGNVKASNTEKVRLSVKEENLFGTGDRLEIFGLYEKERLPRYGSGAAFTKRNFHHSFINLSGGFKTFNPSFNSGRLNEQNYFISADKPLISFYTPWIGSALLSYNRTGNYYPVFSEYDNNFRYRYFTTDIWGGYNLGYKKTRDDEPEKKLRHFVGARSFYTRFSQKPQRFKDIYNYSYADINGMLLSYSLYKQSFYRTNFIYGFGRSEDLPVGFSGALIGGYTNKEGLQRSYYGIEFDASHFSSKGYFTGYTLKAGSFIRSGQPEDADIVAGINHFSKLYRLSRKWDNRNFLTVNFTRQFKTYLSAPLFLESLYGLPYLRNSGIAADERITVKYESVFFNSNKFLGFRFAPFLFGDLSFINNAYVHETALKSFSAIGAGIRTRNENLTFGTIELKGYYFPRTYGDLRNWKVEVSTNIRFRYNNPFIRRPDFISPN